MSFTEYLNKIKIKILAPSTVCFRKLGHFQSELRYWAFLPCWFIFRNQPTDKKGYYKTVYINNKKVKKWSFVPRNALVEVREAPKEPISAILGAVIATIAIGSASISITVGTALLIAGALAAVVAGSVMASGAKGKGSSNNSGSKKYSSKDSPYLSGAKNELAEGTVPIAFGRINQTFCYGQYNIPLVKSGYSGNRYRVYSVAGYENARYSNFKLGDVELNNYRSSAYSLQQTHGTSNFIGWDNACTENFNNKELSFDNTQTSSQSAISYYNQSIDSGSTLKITQTYHFTGVPSSTNWTNKKMDIEATFIYNGEEYTLGQTITITYANLVEAPDGGKHATVNITIPLGEYMIDEYTYTTTTPIGKTRGSKETNLLITLESETLTIDDTQYTVEVEQGVNNYSGDKNEIISQSQRDTKYCDIHFCFPQGLYKMKASDGSRVRTTIKAVVEWKAKGDTAWKGMTDTNIEKIYTRSIDGVVGNLSSRITRSGNTFTFKTPADLNDADDMFYECVGLKFKEAGQYLVRITPVSFTKDNYWVGTIAVSDIVWRLDDNISVINNSILPHVSQIACTFNATSQLDGEVDELNAICFPYIKNIATMQLEQSRNPVDVIYYLLTDTHSNPKPMSAEQIDMPSFLKARQWCEEHQCKCDGIISEEVKYESIIDEICNNNQLYFIPSKWGKCMLKVDTNEDNRPIKTFFNADNSWDLQITRLRGRLGRTLALRFSYTDEDTWTTQEITGYWYDGACHFEPQEGLDDEYYQPEKRDIKYMVNADNIKRRIAYELEIANVKNVTATFKVAREVLDLEVLDRILVADYTRINNAFSGTVLDLIEYTATDGKKYITGVKISQPVSIGDNASVVIRSVDTSGNGDNVRTYSVRKNESPSSTIRFKKSVPISENIIRKSGFYTIDGQEFYHSGDLCMVGTAEILSMTISEIEEISGDDFTSKITCRLY